VTGVAALETSIAAAMVERETSFVMGLSLFAVVQCKVR
jgi:hypothetical protein